ncbi:hypothetical protein BDY19DRAFT_488044 [Irpex rosettiformis]|uniref:Uncharacterized protein n=1 Tax=Irpex rosettiformis TaxID=378272 RepID=A0ACB8UDU5_9APHY|nr:hypothetical protein BDY19DRAFT_488044 [Irpex rosettiformis]
MAQPVYCSPPWLASPPASSSLQQLLRLPVSSPLFEYVVDRLVDTVSAALDRSWDEGQQRSLRTPFLLPFVQSVLTKNRVSAATVLVALVYLDRSRKNLRVSAGFWACERALVGAMILANKYTNDDILSTKAWAISSTIFTSRDVVKAEREFLQVLRYDLSVTEYQLMAHRLPLLIKGPN